jgi:hypothetical protein
MFYRHTHIHTRPTFIHMNSHTLGHTHICTTLTQIPTYVPPSHTHPHTFYTYPHMPYIHTHEFAHAGTLPPGTLLAIRTPPHPVSQRSCTPARTRTDTRAPRAQACTRALCALARAACLRGLRGTCESDTRMQMSQAFAPRTGARQRPVTHTPLCRRHVLRQAHKELPGVWVARFQRRVVLRAKGATRAHRLHPRARARTSE